LRKNYFLQKGKAVAAILLFVVMAIVPSFHGSTATAATKKEYIMVTTQVLGIRGYGATTISLTMPQYQNLEQYLAELGARLNTTTSKNEVVPLFKQAVVKLNEFGVLPRGMSVGQAQRLVGGIYRNFRSSSSIENVVDDAWLIRQDRAMNPNLKNAFCLLYAAATKILGYYTNPIILPFGVLLIFGLLPAIILRLFGAQQLADTLAELGLFIWTANPLRLFNFVLFEGYDVEFRSIGMKGLVHDILSPGGMFMGFSGLMLSSGSDKTYFIGFAFSVNSVS
jgi:hypothetical protein